MSRFEGRKNGVFFFFGLLMAILLLKLFLLQVIQKKYGTGAKSVAVVEEEVTPSRGLIYDRNDSLIVFNAPVYDIYFTLNKLKDADTARIASFLSIDHELFNEKIEEARAKKFYQKPFPLLKRLSERDYAILQEELYQYPALSVKISTERRYRYPNAAMILGYMGEASDKDIEESDYYYTMGDNLGKTGIESSFEDSLRGTKGVQYLLRDKSNVVQGLYKDGKYDIAAIPGQDIVTTLDIELQQYAEQLMNGKVGSVVAIEPATGEILTMVSSPTYDPNWLTGRQRTKYFNALLVDSLKPMFNRAVSAEYAPGSTFKPIASLIALELGAVTEDFQFPCNGGYSRNRGKPGCHGHSHLTGVKDAIKQSCNSYYAENFRRALTIPEYEGDVRKALNTFRDYLATFGYTQKYNIGIGGVEDGFFPTSDYYDKIHNGWDWQPMTVISLSIGQGEVLATTLQMAQSTAVIANRGRIVEPHLIKKMASHNMEQKVEQSPIDKHYFDVVADGMELTFLEGTARGSRIDSISACGKTGTAENFAIVNGKRVQLKDHSLFVAFAPKDDPKIALGIIIENGGFGSTYAAPIASLLIEKYIKDSIPDKRKYIEERMFNANLIGFEKENYLQYVAEQQERKKQRELLKRQQDSLQQSQIIAQQ